MISPSFGPGYIRLPLLKVIQELDLISRQVSAIYIIIIASAFRSGGVNVLAAEHISIDTFKRLLGLIA